MTYTIVSTTHYYPYHRSIISVHSSLQDSVTFFPLGLHRLLLFFLAKTVTFFPLLFFLLLSFRAPVTTALFHTEHAFSYCETEDIPCISTMEELCAFQATKSQHEQNSVSFGSQNKQLAP